MIDMPDYNKSWFYENAFYLTCNSSRIGRFIAHYELFKKSLEIPGAIIECGVFKGTAISRFAMFRQLFGGDYSKIIIGFDMFGLFPDAKYSPDYKAREEFISSAGDKSISVDQLKEVLQKKNCLNNVDLIQGDICKTVPEFIKQNPGLKISLLNLDTDLYEPAQIILEYFYPRITIGGVLIIDDYGLFPGETKAVDDYFREKNVKIQKFPFYLRANFIIKEN